MEYGHKDFGGITDCQGEVIWDASTRDWRCMGCDRQVSPRNVVNLREQRRAYTDEEALDLLARSIIDNTPDGDIDDPFIAFIVEVVEMTGRTILRVAPARER